ncbi:MAG: NACHT domain-containing protein [Oscillatoria sp. SIO1A7]|nr:NACHT domain-containing protein [Oscillatoria sp. SIO1A7]
MKNEGRGRSLVKLGFASICMLVGLVCAPILTEAGIVLNATLATALSSVAAGNTANAIDALLDWRDSDRFSSENEHLSKAVGRAIAAVIDLAAEKQERQVRRDLKKIAARARDNWVEIYRRRLAEEPYQKLTEGKIEEFLTPEEFGLTQTGNLDPEGWGDIFASLNMDARKGGGFELPGQVHQQVAELLHEKFPQALSKILKEDFASDGTVFAPLMLRLVLEMKAELRNIGENTPWLPEALEHFQHLERKLEGTATQQQELFEQISQQIDSRFTEFSQMFETNVREPLLELNETVSDIRAGLMPKSLTLEQLLDICHQNLVAQSKPTTSDFHNADGVTPDLDRVYVPLAIVERKSGKPQGMGQSEQKQEERLTPIAEDSFFEEVLRKGQSEKSQGRRIAIIGEPGSGKTTRLQKIAFWILEEKLGLPIWVSLADLTEATITHHIEEMWLKPTGQSLSIDDLTQYKDRIWLLLDGLDEMTARIEDRHVEQLLKGWVQAARVIVTCRVNVWDADRNAFSGFDIFRNLEFDPEQVAGYIKSWFAEIGDAAKGESLEARLAESENSRLKELVRNPLRLWMLCQIWQSKAGGLPETQAALYGQFVDWVYSWKANEEILEKREVIDKALAQLALAAMAEKEESSRFRLRESWVRETLASRSTFEAAKQLGWLNRVERPPEAICVFYHPTFQEYFAALAVDDWDYFLPKQHRNFPVSDKEYRIFSPQWRQVILLWLGRESGVAEEEKESFIEALLNFDDRCGDWHYDKVDRGFYEYRAYFLAAAGISEFKNCLLADRIVEQIVKWSFGYFNEEKQEWLSYAYRTANAARETLKQTDRDRAIRELSQLLKSPQYPEYTRGLVAETLGQIGQGNKEAIAALLELIEPTEDEYIRRQAAWSLGQIDPGNKEEIAALVEVIETTEDENIRSLAAESLGQIDPGNKEAIAALLELIKTAEKENIRWHAAFILGQIDPGNKEAIAALVKLIETTENEDIRWQAALSLREIGQGNKEAIAALLELMKTTEDKGICLLAALVLGEIGQGNKKAIAALVKLIETTENQDIRRQAAWSLGKIDPGNKEAIAVLLELIKTAEDDNNREEAAWSLGEIGQGNKKAIAALVEVIENTDNEDISWRAADSLGQIDPGNKKAIAALVQVIETTENENIRRRAAESLGKIGQGNKKAIAALVKLIETTEDENIRRQAAESLGKIGKGNKEAIAVLAELLKNTEDEYTRMLAAESLEDVIATPEQQRDIVSALRGQLGNETYEHNFNLFENCYGLLWKIAQDLPYPEFYRAWHGSNENKTSPINLAELPELLEERLKARESSLAENLQVNNVPVQGSLDSARNRLSPPGRLRQRLRSARTVGVKQVLWIDGSKFIDRDNPAKNIYRQMTKQGCPKSEDGKPESMAGLQDYWEDLVEESEYSLALIFYEDPRPPEPQGFSDVFLKALTRFDGAICVVGDVSASGLQTFSPQDPQLVESIIAWLVVR